MEYNDLITKPVDWDFMLKTIQRQRCILFLGPEIFVNAQGESLQKEYFTKLALENRDKILAYNDHDGFFLFESPQAKTRIFYNILEFYEQNFEQEMLKMIAEIPFHVVVSLNPDMNLTKIMDDNGFENEFHFYDRKHKKDILDAPTKTKPLIYNLFGSVSNEETLILTHDDLYEYFRAQMGNVELPLELNSALQSALNYVFLGFQFDKWYVQLLLSLLNLHDEKYKFIRFASSQKLTSDISSLCTKHFKIEFVDNNIKDFVKTLHEKCNAAGILRKPIVKTGQDTLNQIKGGRVGELKNLLEREYKLLSELEKKLGLESDPKISMKLEDDIDSSKEKIAKYETEIKTL